MLFSKVNRINVPKHLDAVTTRSPDEEINPSDVGMSRDGVESIWKSVESYYQSGLQPGMTLVIRRHGEIVLKRAIGHARSAGLEGDAEPARLMQPDDPVCLFSASKAVTALLMHKLEELGFVDLDERVATYLPEYGVNGKENTTLRHVLSHRAGIPSVPMNNPHPSLLYQWDTIIDLLCSGHTTQGAGEKQAYHAITGGYVLGEVARRVTGKEMNELLKEYFADPLGCKYFTYGLADEHHGVEAANYSTGKPPFFPVNVLAKKALSIEFEKIAPITNDPGFLKAVIPAGNMYANADEISRFYQMMLDNGQFNGQQVLEAETVEKAISPVGKLALDGTLMIPMRYSSGLMLGESLVSLFGIRSGQAFGHLGLINIVTWADPERDISVGFLNTGKSLEPANFTGMGKVLWAISHFCPRVS